MASPDRGVSVRAAGEATTQTIANRRCHSLPSDVERIGAAEHRCPVHVMLQRAADTRDEIKIAGAGRVRSLPRIKRA